MKFDFDPAPIKIVIMGILLFLESLCGGILVILQKGAMPTTIELLTILLVASLILISYFITFLKKEETKEET